MKPPTSNISRKHRRAEAIWRWGLMLLGTVLVMLAGWLALFRVGTSLRYLSYDIPFLVHRAGTPDDLRIVYLDRLDGDTLDRGIQTTLLDRLNEADARAVIYDVVFDQPADDPETDRRFAEAIRRFRGVDGNGQAIPGARQRGVLLACWREEVRKTGVIGEQLRVPVDELLDAAGDFGLVAFVCDENYTVRELSTGTLDEASLAWKTARLLGTSLREEDRLASRWINYAGPPASPEMLGDDPAFLTCGVSDALNGTAPGYFRDKIVVVGGKPGITGVELGRDLFATPFHRFDRRGDLPKLGGVELQANAIANLKNKNWLTRSDRISELALILGAGLLASVIFTKVRPLPGAAVCLGLIVLLASAGVFTVHFGNWWFPWSIVAFLQVPMAYVWGTGTHFYIERLFRMRLSAEQVRLHDAFAKYLSPQMLERLVEEGFQPKPGGIKLHAAMMFTDIENFTDMCEQVADPDRIVETLNDYFERTTLHIFDREGVIIKYIGDAIFAAWGAPAPDPEAATHAAAAAWELFQSNRLVVDGREMKTRIGLHYGEVVSGHVGSRRRMDYTLIGDGVNLAARLEGLNKFFGTHILMSGEMAEKIGPGFRLRRVGRFRVKGRKAATGVFELLGPIRHEAEPEWITNYHRALDFLEANDPESAREWFTRAKTARGPAGDGASRFHLDRLDAGQVSKDGITELSEK